MDSRSPNRQTRKRLATRQKISDTATRLFIERGFDQVTVDEVAEAADVSRMTVFNHFARKEDLFFDLDEEGREDLLSALEAKDPAIHPVEALRLFAHWAMAHQRPYVRFFEPGSDRFMATIQASEALKARARAIRDELTETLSVALAKSLQQPKPAAATRLAASLLVASWTVALGEAHRTFQLHHDAALATGSFLELIDRGARGVQAALEEQPDPAGQPPRTLRSRKLKK